MIDHITQYLSWLSILLAAFGICLMLFDVFPRQYVERKVRDQYTFERKRLPILSISFFVLAALLGSIIVYNTISGLNGTTAYTNMTRVLVNLMIFLGGVTWASLYRRRVR